MTYFELTEAARAAAMRFIETLPSRPVHAAATIEALRTVLGGPTPEAPADPDSVLESLVRGVEPGLVASAGPRYFGFVTGGTLPVALAAEWLTAAWDQNAFGSVMSPAASVVEEVCAAWLLDLFGLPSTAGVGLVTGGQMANFTGLCAGRDAVLQRAGFELEECGLAGAPPVTVFASDAGHITILSALRMLGIGTRQVVQVPSDGQGRMRAPELAAALRGRKGPLLVCAQAGNVNTGAFDPLDEIVDAAHAQGAWVHVDGAFGLWAAMHPELRVQLAGYEAADSWAVDGHKWLNVAYDCGIAIVADREAHRRALRVGSAAYLVTAQTPARDGSDWAPESSRRARAFAVYAVLRALGRSGLSDLVGRCCALAQRMAAGLARDAGATIVNDVVLNQVLVRFDASSGDAASGDALTRAVVDGMQRDGTCWAGGSVYGGRAVMRISVSNWSTTEHDIDRSVTAIAKVRRSVAAASAG